MSVEEEAATVSGEEVGAAPPENENSDPSSGETAASTETEGGGEAEGGTEEKTGADARKDQLRSEIQELANAKRELKQEVETLKAQFREKQELDSKPFISLDMERINAHIAQASDRIEELKLEGNHFAAQKLQRDLDKLIDEVEANEAKRGEWEQRQGQTLTQQQQAEAAIKELDAAADFFREHKKIPAEVWNKGADQWLAMRQADPLLDRQYADLWMRQGPIAAIQFAHDHVIKAQAEEAKKLEAAKAKKDAGKVNITGAGEAPQGIKTWDQLMGLGSTQVAAYKKNNPKHYQQLLDNHLK